MASLPDQANEGGRLAALSLLAADATTAASVEEAAAGDQQPKAASKSSTAKARSSAKLEHERTWGGAVYISNSGWTRRAKSKADAAVVASACEAGGDANSAVSAVEASEQRQLDDAAREKQTQARCP